MHKLRGWHIPLFTVSCGAAVLIVFSVLLGCGEKPRMVSNEEFKLTHPNPPTPEVEQPPTCPLTLRELKSARACESNKYRNARVDWLLAGGRASSTGEFYTFGDGQYCVSVFLTGWSDCKCVADLDKSATYRVRGTLAEVPFHGAIIDNATVTRVGPPVPDPAEHSVIVKPERKPQCKK